MAGRLGSIANLYAAEAKVITEICVEVVECVSQAEDDVRLIEEGGTA